MVFDVSGQKIIQTKIKNAIPKTTGMEIINFCKNTALFFMNKIIPNEINIQIHKATYSSTGCPALKINNGSPTIGSNSSRIQFI